MLSTLVAVSLQIERDAEREESALRERDRAIGRALEGSRKNLGSLLRQWWDRVASEEDRRTVGRARGALRATGALMTVLGALSGVGTAAAVYSYDGSQPINILPALATFVVIPLLLLLPLLLQLVPWSPPGLAGLRDLLLGLGAGVLGLVTRLLRQRHRELLQTALGRGRAHQRVFSRLQKWMLLGWTQSFAVAFHVGAIAWLVARVLVTDLSFTWSTTAEFVTPERVHALTAWLSAPWSAWWPDAVPSLQDVQRTQFFRLGGGMLAGATDPATLGRWWTFLLACMVTYGLLPRVLTRVVCAVGRARAARWTLRHLPRVDDVVDRLLHADVRTRATEPEEWGREPATVEVAADADPSALAGDVVLLRWSGADAPEGPLDEALRRELGVTAVRRFSAGGGQSLREDAEVIEEAAEAVDEIERASLVLLVKSWEPATMDAVDFLVDLRARVGPGVRLLVAALRFPGTGDEADVEQWRRRLIAIGDPWLRTVGLSVEDGGTG